MDRAESSVRGLGIDPGERRVGFAVSDPLGITAQGLETFDANKGVDLVEYIEGLVERYDVGEIVVGHAIGLAGQTGESSRRSSRLAAVIAERLDVKVTLWDERFSSEEAKRVLRGQRAPKTAIDKLAAVIILQSYLDYRRRSE
jgi:putative holliday junction resolvase